MKKVFSMTAAFLAAIAIMAGQCQSAAAQTAEPMVNTKKNSSVFAAMPKNYAFTSGAGAWATEITLKKDGSFTGQYHDSNMGETGVGYPGGTVYICKFSGKFSKPKRVNKYTYTMTLKKFKTNKKPGKVSYKNRIRYITSTPYGFDKGKKFMIYTPGIKMSKLPKGFVSWLYAFMDVRAAKTLPRYGIYNVKGTAGFVAVNN